MLLGVGRLLSQQHQSRLSSRHLGRCASDTITVNGICTEPWIANSQRIFTRRVSEPRDQLKNACVPPTRAIRKRATDCPILAATTGISSAMRSRPNIGGSARGYQSLPIVGCMAIPLTVRLSVGQAVCLCIARLG